jgi:phi13 family phage major tail protein
MANKVELGISQLHICTYTVDDQGAVTLGTPYHQKGAISLSVDAETDSNDFYADNVKYWSGFSDNGFSGSIEVAKFDTDFKTQFLGYQTLTDGGVAAIKGSTKPNVAIMFEVAGDVENRRVIMYNCALGAITREFSTIEESKEPVTESIDITVTGDNGTGITMVSYKPADTGYATLFTNPPVPEL